MGLVNQNFTSQRRRSGNLCAIPSARALPSPPCSSSGSDPARVETLALTCSLELCKGGFFSHSAVHRGSLFSWHLGFTLPWLLTEGFREQRASFRSHHYNLAFKNYYYYYFQGNRDSRSYLLCDFSHPEVFT